MGRRLLTTIVALGALAGWAGVPATLPASASTKTFSYKFGPVDVGPYQAVKDSTVVKTPAMTGGIVRMDARVVDPSGTPIPQSQVMLHHLVFFDGGRPGNTRHDNTCGTAKTPQRFFGTSEELRPLTLPPGYGYPIDSRDSWKSSWMVMNHTHKFRRAYIRYRVTVDSARLKSVRPYWVSIVPCGADPQYSVPGDGKQGATDTRHRRWSVPITGRIVAVGGHLHGGARRLRLSQPRCHRTLVTSKPTYGQPDDPVYQVKPLLHAPDPLNITWWQSKTGIPVLKGETLTVASDYDGQFPQLRVMGIDHIYIASDSKARHDCAPLPADAQELGPDWVGRPAPPHVELTLAQVGPDGYAHPIEAPPGKIVAYKGTASVKEYQYGFHPANIAVNRGAKVRWTFKDPDEHDVTLNNGPIGFGSPWSRSGDVYERRFDVPGTYRLYCSLHPAEMSQVVRVGSKG